MDVAAMRVPAQAGIRADEIEAVIHGTALAMHFQPLVELDGGQTVGYEALARFPGHPDITPDVWFRAAAECGLGVQLEVEVIKRALSQFHRISNNAFLAVNASRSCLFSEDLRSLLEGYPMDRIILEITEQEAIDDYVALNRVLLGLRVAGLRLAVDDAGAGFASMRHLTMLQPDVIKLDGKLVSDIDADHVGRALISALCGFARYLDALVVGEAVETRAQEAALRDIGVNWGQGYLFGRPAPLSPVVRTS
jgi:EAL domain-containing protein (putative c-di-GMP-specific phosphodiesterase class I)